MKKEKKIVYSYRFLNDSIVTTDLNKYSKDIIVLEGHHYTSDLLFLDKIRENAKKLGYLYERELFIDRKYKSYPYMKYEKFNLFTKIDTTKSEEFPMDKIAIYRSMGYGEAYVGGKERYGRTHFVIVEADKYPEYMRLFCGEKGFEWNKTSEMNPINTILIIIVEQFEGVVKEILARYHQNYVLFCVIVIADSHKVIIGPDVKRIEDLTYEKKIEELKFLLGLTDDIESVSTFIYTGDRYKHLFNK